MGKSLVIVESPAKAKTINKYLGKDFVVKSSVGHIRDLPTSGSATNKADPKERAAQAAKTRKMSPAKKAAHKKKKAREQLIRRMGIDPGKKWQANYQILPGKEKVVNELKALAANSDAVYLATDLDREGEAIAWHLAECLGVEPEQAQRVKFNAITKAEIARAFEEPLNIDLTLPGKLRLIGQVPGRWSNTAIFVDTGKESAKRLMTPWMHYLAWTAQQPDDEATTRLLLCAREKNGSVYAEHIKFEMAGSAEERKNLAQAELTQLVQWYLLGKKHPLRFMQKTSHAFAEAAHGVLSASQFAHGPAGGLTDDQYEVLLQARKKAKGAWESNQNFSGEGADYHLAKTFEYEPPYVLTRGDGSETAHPDFAWYALKFWTPLLNARHEETTS